MKEDNSIAGRLNDDDFMVKEHLRQPSRQERDKSVWTKTKEEKEALAKVRHLKYYFSRSSKPFKPIWVPGTLIVYTKGLEKTTFSHKCWQSDINSIISRYKSKCKVLKYSWNGKTYNVGELPYWK